MNGSGNGLLTVQHQIYQGLNVSIDDYPNDIADCSSWLLVIISLGPPPFPRQDLAQAYTNTYGLYLKKYCKKMIWNWYKGIEFGIGNENCCLKGIGIGIDRQRLVIGIELQKRNWPQPWWITKLPCTFGKFRNYMTFSFYIKFNIALFLWMNWIRRNTG